MDSTSSGNELFPIKIVTKSDEFVVNVHSKMNINSLKWKIREQSKIEPMHQRLFFEGIELEEPEFELSFYGIEAQIGPDGFRQNTELKIILAEIFQGIPQTFFLHESHYDPKWNCSFEGISSVKKVRGGKTYFQPFGCVRYGLKVLGKYENDTWLGGKGFRTEDEWPVAYHGTKELNVLKILQNDFPIENCFCFAKGKGIYCSPNPQLALDYAHQYTFQDKLYKLILQCRIDPQNLKICGNKWLVTGKKHIRPYAICVFADDKGKWRRKLPNYNAKLERRNFNENNNNNNSIFIALIIATILCVLFFWFLAANAKNEYAFQFTTFLPFILAFFVYFFISLA